MIYSPYVGFVLTIRCSQSVIRFAVIRIRIFVFAVIRYSHSLFAFCRSIRYLLAFFPSCRIDSWFVFAIRIDLLLAFAFVIRIWLVSRIWFVIRIPSLFAFRRYSHWFVIRIRYSNWFAFILHSHYPTVAQFVIRVCRLRSSQWVALNTYEPWYKSR
jgi:hypothetical protein